MKHPRTKKKSVNAYVLIGTRGNIIGITRTKHDHWAGFIGPKPFSMESRRKAFPCTITYTLPTKTKK